MFVTDEIVSDGITGIVLYKPKCSIARLLGSMVGDEEFVYYGVLWEDIFSENVEVKFKNSLAKLFKLSRESYMRTGEDGICILLS